jgi:mercuric ion binding protein
MRIQIALLSLLFFVVGCTSEEKPVFIRKESYTVSTPNKVVSNKLVAMEIEGMTCVMGCGASIRKELYTTNAVSSVEFDFKEGRKLNTVKIAFDSAKISSDEMVSIISKMNEKQFSLGKISEEEYKK